MTELKTGDQAPDFTLPTDGNGQISLSALKGKKVVLYFYPKDRYARQIVLPEIGKDGQDALKSASILCIGAGGLGAPALLYLAAAGIGHITIIDHDSVSLSNLQRQIIFTMDDIGKNKAETAAMRLQDLNPDIQITALSNKFTAENAQDLIASHDLTIDATDNFDTKFLINDAAYICSKPWIYASILGFEAQIAVFNHQGGPCYRCLYPSPPTQNVASCNEAGIIGALAGMIGSMQAMEAIKLITAHESFAAPQGKILTYDAKTIHMRSLELNRDSECATCARPPEEVTLPHTVNEITINDAQNDNNSLFIDVREHDEWEAGHIDGADHMPLSDLLNGLRPDLPKDQPIILYCKKGMRSQQAYQILKSQGYTNLRSLTGGIEAWTTKPAA